MSCARAAALTLILLLLLAGCAPHRLEPPHAPGYEPPRLSLDGFHSGDGTVLPLRIWQAAQPRAVIVALHGFNDYRAAFDLAAPLLAARGVAVIAYDQRGFGASPGAGRWAGGERLAADALNMVRLARTRFPGCPVFLLGESMGAAVALLAAASPESTGLVRGVILASPATWGWSELNPFYRFTLWTVAHIAPGWRLSGRGLGRVASDNIDALRAMGRDPLVIKETRVDAIYGLVDLMQAALEAAPDLRVPALVLIGDRDEIVPAHAMQALVARLPPAAAVCRFPEGYHLLLRDRGRAGVITPVLAFVRQVAQGNGPAAAVMTHISGALSSSGDSCRPAIASGSTVAVQ